MLNTLKFQLRSDDLSNYTTTTYPIKQYITIDASALKESQEYS